MALINSSTPTVSTPFSPVSQPFSGGTSDNYGVFGTPLFVDHTNSAKVTEKKDLNKWKPGSADDKFGVEGVNEIPMFAKYFGQETKAEKKRREEEERKRQETQDLLASLLPKYDAADTQYQNTYAQNTAAIKKLMDEYLKQFETTMQGSIASSEQARDSYADTWLGSGGMKDAMTKNAQSALTLEELMDPDNKVATAYRESYEKDAQRARQQGQQDYGVLSALGAQAAQGQFGMSGPMTAGAMGQIYAQNQNQAGEAYARAQQRMYDLQQQGRKAGEEQTKISYEAGQKAIADLLRESGAFSSSQDASNKTIAGLAGLLKTGQDSTQQYYTSRDDELAGIKHSNTTNSLNRQGSLATGEYDWLTQMNERAAGREAADQASRDQLLATIATLFAGGLGGAAAGAGTAAAASSSSGGAGSGAQGSPGNRQVRSA